MTLNSLTERVRRTPATVIVDMHYPHAFRDLAVFVEVADRRSFSKAAAVLGMPISSVSRRIRALEEALAVRLIERTTRRFRLTPDGETWLPQITRCVTDANRMLAQMKGAEGRDVAECLTFVLPDEPWAAAGLAEAVAGAPRTDAVRLRIALTGTDALPEADVLVRSDPRRPANGGASPIGCLETALFASPSYIAAHGLPDHPDALQGHSIILAADCGEATWILSRADEHVTVALRAAITAANTRLALAFALAGNGIVAAERMVAGVEVGHERLVPVLPDWRLPHRDVSCLRGARTLSPQAADVVASITRGLAETLRNLDHA